jgi:protein phosphatase
MIETDYLATAQSIGARKNQEDRVSVFLPCVAHNGKVAAPPAILAILADGMGGHAAGDVAAELAVSTFQEMSVQHGSPFHTKFVAALDHANRAIAGHVNENPDKSGMGCTLVAAELSWGEIRWISVGDSLLLHYSNGALTRLNADHSLAPQLDAAAKRGEISFEEAAQSPNRHALLSALNGEPIDLFDCPNSPLPLSPEDWIIFASDGLETMPHGEVCEILQRHETQSAETICQALLSAVADKQNARQDNTSLIVIKASLFCEIDQDEIVTRPMRAR